MDDNKEREYTSKEYWDKRYESDENAYDWYFPQFINSFYRTMDYKTFKQFEIERFVKKTDSILFPGCGNSCIF